MSELQGREGWTWLRKRVMAVSSKRIVQGTVSVAIALLLGLFFAQRSIGDTSSSSDQALDQKREDQKSPPNLPAKGGLTESANSGPSPGSSSIVGASAPPFFPIWATEDARDVLRAGDPIERILTPTSEADQAWMLAYAYPRPQDYRTRSIAELERAFANAGNDGRPLGQSSRDYAANAIAAAKWEAKDPEWRDWARSSQSPFAHALVAADAMQRFRSDPANPSVRQELQRAVSAAYARGERALAIEYLSEASMYAGFHRAPNSNLTALFDGFSQIDLFNTRLRAAGVARPPMRFDTRPAPVWSLYGQLMREEGG